MPDWQKYPLVRLFIPFVLGTTAGYLCVVEWQWAVVPLWGFCLMALCVCTAAVCHGRICGESKSGWHIAYRTAVGAFCFLAGLTLSTRSHRQAVDVYGDRFRYEIYRQNNFQIERAARWQQTLHQHFTSTSCDGSTQRRWAGREDECAVVEAMSTGWRKGLSAALKQRFARAGISHVLALSGFHVGIIFIVLLLLPRRLCHTLSGRRMWQLASLTILWAYAFTTGMSPSIVRAVIMCSIITVSQLSERDVSLINSATLAAFIMLAFDPLLVSHIGFQLSFCCIYGIALTEQWIPRNYILGGTVLSIVCTVATFPLVALHFGSVPLLGLVSNFFAMILVPTIMLLTAVWWLAYSLCLLLPILHILSDAVTSLLGWVSWALIRVADTVSGQTFSAASYHPSWAETVCWYAALLTAVSILHKPTGRRICILLLTLTGVLLAAIMRKTGMSFAFFTE